MRQIKAKFRAHNVVRESWGTRVQMSPVYSSDQTSENYSWSQATPSGQLDMTITNPEAAAAFEANKEYVVTFEAAD